MTKFGRCILEARLIKGLSQTKLAKELGVGTSTTNMWESDRRLPRAENLPRIARLLDIDLKELAHLYAESLLGIGEKGKE